MNEWMNVNYLVTIDLSVSPALYPSCDPWCPMMVCMNKSPMLPPHCPGAVACVMAVNSCILSLNISRVTVVRPHWSFWETVMKAFPLTPVVMRWVAPGMFSESCFSVCLTVAEQVGHFLAATKHLAWYACPQGNKRTIFPQPKHVDLGATTEDETTAVDIVSLCFVSQIVMWPEFFVDIASFFNSQPEQTNRNLPRHWHLFSGTNKIGIFQTRKTLTSILRNNWNK